MKVFKPILFAPDFCKVLGLIKSPLPQDIEKFLSIIKHGDFSFVLENSASKIFIL